jgi:hypothetical protein
MRAVVRYGDRAGHADEVRLVDIIGRRGVEQSLCGEGGVDPPRDIGGHV